MTLYHNVIRFLHEKSIKLVGQAQCGESAVSALPTLLWAVGAAALAHRLLHNLFRHILFRRVPLWELILQNLLFLWMVVYSIYFWSLMVNVIKATVVFIYETDEVKELTAEELAGRKLMQHWIIWMCSVLPLFFYLQTRPRPDPPPLMIWITTSPWQRREMGPYGYYLNRPLSSLQSSPRLARRSALTLRRAFSDSKVILKQPVKKRRYSKSV